MKKRFESANITCFLNDGQYSSYYECVTGGRCTLGLFPIMPPEEDDEYTFRDHGACINPHAQQAALEALRKEITAEIKRIELEREED